MKASLQRTNLSNEQEKNALYRFSLFPIFLLSGRYLTLISKESRNMVQLAGVIRDHSNASDQCTPALEWSLIIGMLGPRMRFTTLVFLR